MQILKKIAEARIVVPYGLSYVYIASSMWHRIFICQRNFDTLCAEIINPCVFEDLPAKVKEALNHEK